MTKLAEENETTFSERLNVTTPVVIGFSFILLFVVGFGGWLAFAPLESAAIARGVVSVDTKRKTIQHLEGGIVKEILVRDGDNVGAGKVLLRLDDTQPLANLTILQTRQLIAEAQEARILAEHNQSSEVSFPTFLKTRKSDPQIKQFLLVQKRLFKGKRLALKNQIKIIQRQTNAHKFEIRGLQNKIGAQSHQIKLLQQEIEIARNLVKKGFAKLTRLLNLERNKSEIEAGRSENMASISRTEQIIAKLSLQVSELINSRNNQINEELSEIQKQKLDLLEKIQTAKDVLRRTEIRAPLAGTIVALKVHTLGGVISPGQPLLDIVPAGDPLVIDAKIEPKDIDIVRVGQPVLVRYTALNQRSTPPMDGKLTGISADRLIEDRTGKHYYLGLINIEKEKIDNLGKIKIVPGMQVEVLIMTGENTMLNYLLKPITDSFYRAFREN